MSLQQIPFFPRSPAIKEYDVDLELREDLIKGNKGDSSFEDFIFRLIPFQIPRCYIEGYQDLKNNSENIRWPRSPRVIFTSNAIIGDDFFKFWAARMIESGSLLVCGQHGGQYGVGKLVPLEEHERAVSDYFLSWGWNGNDVIPLPSSKLTSIRKRRSQDQYSNGNILLVSTSVPRYSYFASSITISEQYLTEFYNQVEFIGLLGKSATSKLEVKLDKNKFHGWEQEGRMTEIFPDTNFICQYEEFTKIMYEKKLIICTYNATAFLESMSANIPTVLFWDPNIWQIRESAKGDFLLLESVGILHYSAESAAECINNIWNNVGTWWNEPCRVKAVEEFCYKYARKENNWRKKWKFTMESLNHAKL